MGEIWIRELTGGLDARRLPETTPGGVLIQGLNGHITRGGEFEKRPAFVKEYDIPAGTKGLAANKSGLVVFGSGPQPTLPAGVRYQQLQHPDGETQLSRILSYDLFSGQIYVAAEFADGERFHFYNGLQVEDWYDGRARARFTVVEGEEGTSILDNLTVDGVAILQGPINWTDSNSVTAQLIVDAINAYVTVPEYVATADDDAVNIIVSTPGKVRNGRQVAFELTGGFAVSPETGLVLSGGGGDYRAAAGAKTRLSVATTTINAVSDIKIDGNTISGGRITYRATLADTATAIAAAISSYTTVPEYTATSAANIVTVLAPLGDDYNGKTLAITTAGDVTVTSVASFSGGSESTAATASFHVSTGTTNEVTTLKAAGEDLIDDPVIYISTNRKFRDDLVSAINAYSATSKYTAAAVDDTENNLEITANPEDGAAANGRTLTFTASGGAGLKNLRNFSGGQTLVDVQLPGPYVRTIGSKMYAVSASNLHFSGIEDPTQWTTDVVGAGFIDMSSYDSGSEELKAVAKYQNDIAIFSERNVQIWHVDPDPTLNTQSQVLNNTGTVSPRSVTQFSDSDLFYLSESGLRSLRARSATISASTTDIGVPVDPLITNKLKNMTADQRDAVVGLIEPQEGRFWLMMGRDIFIFSFFNGAKVSAWSRYETSTTVDGDTAYFDPDTAVIYDRRIYIRAGDEIYSFGGTAIDPQYDETVAVVQIPYLDADQPTKKKNWQAIDAAAEGLWKYSAAMLPKDPAARDVVAIADGSTFMEGRLSMSGMSTHISIVAETQGSGYARLGAFVIHYESNTNAD